MITYQIEIQNLNPIPTPPPRSHACPLRLGEDDRLDTILSHLRQKAPGADRPDAVKGGGAGGGDRSARPATAGGGSEAGFSVKSELAKGLREVKGRIKGLEDRLASKKKALAAEGGLGGHR